MERRPGGGLTLHERQPTKPPEGGATRPSTCWLCDAHHLLDTRPVAERYGFSPTLSAVARSKVSPWGFVGMGGMACVLFLDLGTVTVAPWWVSTLFLLLWLVLFVLAARWFVPWPRRVPWLPLLAFAVWLPTIALGTRNLGWG